MKDGKIRKRKNNTDIEQGVEQQILRDKETSSSKAAPAAGTQCRYSRTRLVTVLLAVLLLLLGAVIFIHEVYHYQQLNSINLPVVSIEGPADIFLTSTAVVSMHRGAKYWGYLGTWLESTKIAYAARHSYGYFGDWPAESDLVPLSPWHQKHAIYFDKPRLLLYVLQNYPNLQTILWIDGDAVVSEPQITVEQKVQELSASKKDVCMIWTKDGMGPNAGILLLVNTPTTRQLLSDSLSFVPKDPTFADQAALTELIDRNQTYQDCVVLVEDSRQLQSRVRGYPSILYKPGDWILHLPNHNRFELLTSLTQWLPAKKEGD